MAIPRLCTTLGDHIRMVRMERGGYQSQIAELMKVTTDTVTNWELNRTTIPRLYYPIIQEYLGYLPKEFEMSYLSYQILRYRWEKGLSIKQLAKEIGVYHDCVKKAEIGKSNFQKRTIDKIEEFITPNDTNQPN